MHKGTIVLVPFPFTDLSGQKVRPALILAVQKKGEDCIVAFISSNTDGAGAFSVSIPATPTNGLKVSSVVRIDKIATLQKKIFLGELGKLEPKHLSAVDKKLSVLFGL